MSLLDALLLDAYREPKEVWITLRQDGQIGSGTQSDPYDGGTIYSNPVSLESLTAPNPDDPLEAVAVTSVPHGFQNDDIVEIFGAGANGDWWDGPCQVYGIVPEAPNAFKYRMKSKPLPGSPAGRLVRKPLTYRLEDRLTELPANAALHISPGTFEIRGTPGGCRHPGVLNQGSASSALAWA